MMRRVAPVALAFLLLAVPVVDAAASGARAPIDVPCTPSCTVNDVDIVPSTSAQCSTSLTPTPSNAPCRFTAVTNDGPRIGFTGEANAATWTLWNQDGSTRQSRGADHSSCPPPADAFEDCDTDVTEVAVSATGTRIAVASEISSAAPVRFVIQVFDDTGAVRAYHTLADGHTVNDLAINAAGTRVAVGVSVAPTTDPTGMLYLLDAGTNTVLWDYATADPVTTVDIGGNVLAAAAGPFHLRFILDGTTDYPNNAISGNVLDVDASVQGGGWSVAGYSSGFFAVYSSHQDTGRKQPSIPDYQKKEAGESTAANAVAIREDATMFAVGHEGGHLRLYTLDPASAPEATVTLAADKDALGGIDRLAFSADGRYLAMLSGDNLRLFYTGNNLLEEMWSDTRAGASSISAMAIDGRGEHLVLGVGEDVIVYDAIHRIQATLGTATHLAGETKSYSVNYRNDGNRAEALTVTAAPPSGVTTTVEPSSFTLLPTATQQVTVTVTVPATQPDGTLRIPLTAQVNGGTDGSQVNNLDLTVPIVHSIIFETDADSVGANLGGAAVFEVTATNEGNVDEDVQLRVNGLTGGWTAAIEPAQLTLGPGESEEVRVSLQPPAGLANGARIDVELTHDGPDPNPLPLTATVGAIFNMKVTAPVGTTINPGVAAVVNLTVRNDGNTRDSAVVSLAALPAGWVGGFVNGVSEFDVQDLEPCATNAAACSQVVQMTLRAPADYDSEVPVQISIIAKSVGDEAKTSTARLLVTVAGPQTVTNTETEDGGGGSGIPGPAPVLVMAALALAALGVRRRLR